jgi:hypothetical protein
MTSSKSCKWRGKVHNHLRTYGSEGVTEPGRDGPVGPAHSGGRFGPPFLALEGSSTLKSWRRHHSIGESHSHQEAIHKLEREEGDLRREIVHLEGSTDKWRRRKTPSEGKP